MRLFDLAWIVIIASLPVFRTLQAVVSDNVIVAIQSFIVICVLFRCVRRPYFAPVWILAALAIPLAGLISGAASSPIASLRTAIGIGIMVGLFPFVARFIVVERPHVVRRGIAAFVVVQSVSALVGIVQAQTGLEIFGNVAREGRANGLAGHPNMLAFMAMLAVLIGLSVLARERRGKVLLAVAISVGINAFALFETGSISVLAMLALGIVVLLIRMPEIWRVVGAFMAFLVVGAVVLSLAGVGISSFFEETQGRVLDVTGEVDGIGSWQIRQETWAIGWERIQLSPIVGWGMDGTNASVYGISAVHNVLLRTWYQGGIVLFAVFALLTVTFITIVFGRRRGPNHALAAAVVAAIWGFSMTSAFYVEPHYWIPLILAVAMISPVRDSTGGDKVRHVPVRSPNHVTSLG